MDRLSERLDFGIGEELDFSVDWAVLAGGRAKSAPPSPVRREAAVPNGTDVAGAKLVASFATIMGGFPIFFASGPLTKMAIVIGLLSTAVILASRRFSRPSSPTR